MTTAITHTVTQKTLALGVHLFTSAGVIAAFMAIRAISEGELYWQREAMLWLILALFIDGVDGALARLFKAKEVLPDWDGRAIDYVIDFLTYAVIPAFFIYRADMVPESLVLPTVFAVLLTSAMYYGKMGMVSDDMYFVGFPVMWNMVAYYLFFIINVGYWGNFGLIIFFCIMHFVPLKYVYPSRTKQFKWLTIGNTILFLISNVVILYLYPERNIWLTVIALITLAYYTWMTVYASFIKEDAK